MVRDGHSSVCIVTIVLGSTYMYSVRTYLVCKVSHLVFSLLVTGRSFDLGLQQHNQGITRHLGCYIARLTWSGLYSLLTVSSE